ncbi:hypothetical protein BKH43_07735 [Helicobacter sp. 13S00401-1]|uniref:thioredoxin fold domain-containing protein n=1 Tax=Helicobacter sp. 13S00401-1 TaxID=1905758 RepID=UPI000BA7D0AD|nr:thioredoxin fold domain-containing protein [Helicobacter sp. 13S00401-1]PAF48785.1 hypothetical protein BKH43_07735 [Helicobacter sp. 13S00401-1]
MKKYILYGSSILIAGVLIACGGDDDVSVSTGSSLSSSQVAQLQNIDEKSYAGLTHVFKPTSDIKTDDKPTVLIFGQNNCYYCDKLKKDIKEDKPIQDYMAKDFSAYYINISYTKTHDVEFLNNKKIDTLNLARMYNVAGTPSLIFASKTGATVLRVPGYVSQEVFINALNFTKDESLWEKASTPGDRMKLFATYNSQHPNPKVAIQ